MRLSKFPEFSRHDLSSICSGKDYSNVRVKNTRQCKQQAIWSHHAEPDTLCAPDPSPPFKLTRLPRHGNCLCLTSHTSVQAQHVIALSVKETVISGQTKVMYGTICALPADTCMQGAAKHPHAGRPA